MVVTPLENVLLPVTVSCAAFEITPAARIASAAALLLRQRQVVAGGVDAAQQVDPGRARVEGDVGASVTGPL